MTPEQRERRNAWNRADYAANREKETARKRAYAAANPERVRASHRAHKERKRARDQSYRELERARTRAWHELNRERVRAYHRAYKQHLRDAILAFMRSIGRRPSKMSRVNKRRHDIQRGVYNAMLEAITLFDETLGLNIRSKLTGDKRHDVKLLNDVAHNILPFLKQEIDKHASD